MRDGVRPFRLVLVLTVLVVGGVLAAPSLQGAAPWRAVEAAAVVEDGSFDSNGVRIHYSDDGDGDTVVLLHGLLGNAQQWQGVATALLDAGYRVVAIDARGHGQSDKPLEAGQYGVAMVEDVGRLLDHLELNRVHLVGYSMGGLITNRFRAEHPERLMSATMGGFGWINAGSPLADTTGLADSLAGSDLGPLLSALTPGAPALPEQQRTAMSTAVFAANDPLVIAAVVRGFRDIDNHTAESLGANQVPTLALVGDQDALVRDVRAMKEVMANLEVEEIAGANHLTAQANPRFLERLLAFLSEH